MSRRVALLCVSALLISAQGALAQEAPDQNHGDHDEDSGEIVVVEADVQQDITDVPPAIVAILAKSGVCLAELDELIMLEGIVYGK